MRHLMFMVAAATLVMAAEGESVLSEPQVDPGEVRVQPPTLPSPEGLSVTLEEYPRTSGSTSAEPLGVWVACRLLGRECSWPLNIRGERRLLPSRADAEAAPAEPDPYDGDLYQRIRHVGTHGSYRRLINGKVDMIFECRRPSEDEQEEMDRQKVELVIRPVALDAFVFLRHKDNPVTGLTLAQVRDIYTAGTNGEAVIGNWGQVGGPDAAIHGYVRNRNSGSQETMQSLVMKERPMVGGPTMTGSTMMGPYNRLHKDPSGIGFTFLYYQRYMAPMSEGRIMLPEPETEEALDPSPAVEMFAIDGVMPSRETIANRSYPLVTEVYVVTRVGLEPAHPAAALRDWLVTDEGQSIVAETGYVPVARSREAR